MLAPRARKLTCCHRCGDPITNFVFANNTCEHLSCGQCYFTRLKIQKTKQDFCWTCNNVSTKITWELSKPLTRSKKNGHMLMCLYYLQYVIFYMLVVLCFVLVAGFPRSLHFWSERVMSFDIPQNIILQRLPYSYYWFEFTLVVMYGLYVVSRWIDIQ